MRALIALLPLVAAQQVTVTDTTCGATHSQTTHRYITGQFVSQGEGVSLSNAVHLGDRIQNQVETHTFQHTGGLNYGPGCFKIHTTNSDGWQICQVQVSSATGGTHGQGGTWTWTGEQWVDNPCTGGYVCTPTFTICDWNHAATPATAAPTEPPCQCEAWVGEHYTGGRQNQYGPSSTSFTEELHANAGGGQASRIRVVGTPGCQVVLACNAGMSYGRSLCTYHSNSYCNSASTRTAPCLDASGNWKQVVTVPASGEIRLIMQHNDPRHATLTLEPRCSGVSGDPFVTYMGKKTQVWLPLEKDISLMQCGAWELHGTAFGSGVAGDSQQWFRSLSLRARGAEQLRVAAGAEQFEMEAAPQSFFNYTKKAETVTVTAAGIDLDFVYARVNKDAAGGRMHVDLKINKVDESACHGALPEIWGLVPMSEATAAMLLPPKA